MVGQMISSQVPKSIRDQFDRPSNVHGKQDQSFCMISDLSCLLAYSQSGDPKCKKFFLFIVIDS